MLELIERLPALADYRRLEALIEHAKAGLIPDALCKSWGARNGDQDVKAILLQTPKYNGFHKGIFPVMVAFSTLILVGFIAGYLMGAFPSMTTGEFFLRVIPWAAVNFGIAEFSHTRYTEPRRKAWAQLSSFYTAYSNFLEWAKMEPHDMTRMNESQLRRLAKDVLIEAAGDVLDLQDQHKKPPADLEEKSERRAVLNRLEERYEVRHRTLSDDLALIDWGYGPFFDRARQLRAQAA